jgi:hypothetical protein
MALNPYLTQARGAAMLDNLVDAIDTGGAGTIKFYTGTQAATANTALGAQVLLATLTFSATAFGAATAADPSVATAAAITSDSSADATGTVTWCRWANGSGTTILDCSAGAASGTFDIEFNTDAFVTGATVSITALTVTMPLRI